MLAFDVSRMFAEGFAIYKARCAAVYLVPRDILRVVATIS